MSDRVQKMADELVEKLGEHCDSVRVFCTYRAEDGDTSAYTVGDGNFYAQSGQVQEWVAHQDEIVRSRTRKEDGDEADDQPPT